MRTSHLSTETPAECPGVGAGTPHSTRGTSIAKTILSILNRHTECGTSPPNFQPPHLGVGPAFSASLPLPPVLMLPPFHIPSYSTSFQLDLRRLWMMVVPQFSCTSHVVMGGCECCIHLFHHPNQKHCNKPCLMPNWNAHHLSFQSESCPCSRIHSLLCLASSWF